MSVIDIHYIAEKLSWSIMAFYASIAPFECLNRSKNTFGKSSHVLLCLCMYNKLLNEISPKLPISGGYSLSALGQILEL